MARPRSFDEIAVLDAAAAQFRVHGFAETSTAQLCEASGLRRSSLYNAFTSKEELYVLALERYTASTRAAQEEVLGDASRDGRARLEALMGLIVGEERAAREAGHAAGCMTLQTLMSPDLRAQDERLDAILDRDQRLRAGLLEDAIRSGQADGSLVRDVPPPTGARLVTTVISGLRASAQAGLAPDELLDLGLLGIRPLFA